MATIAEEIHALVEQLPASAQQRILDYTRELSHTAAFPRSPLPPGTPGHVAAQLRVAPDVGAAMEQALEECEWIDPDE